MTSVADDTLDQVGLNFSKKRRIESTIAQPLLNQFVAQSMIKQEQQLFDLFANMVPTPQFLASQANHQQLTFNPFMMSPDMLSFPMSSISTMAPLPMFSVKKEEEELESPVSSFSSSNSCSGDCFGECSKCEFSNDEAGLAMSFFDQKENGSFATISPSSALELTDLPDIEDLTAGLCMNTVCTANRNRTCLISEMDLGSSIFDEVDGIFDSASISYSDEAALSFDLDLDNMGSVAPDNYTSFPRSLSTQQFEEDFLLS